MGNTTDLFLKYE